MSTLYHMDWRPLQIIEPRPLFTSARAILDLHVHVYVKYVYLHVFHNSYIHLLDFAKVLD